MAKKFRGNRGLEKTCLSIIRWGSYLILFTPLIISAKFFFPFVGLKSIYFMGLAEIIFFTWLVLIISNPKYRPHFNPILGSLILFLIILIISALLGVDPFYSFWSKFERMAGILMMLHLLAFFLVISSTIEESDWKKIFATSIFAGVITGIIALISKNPAMRGGATIGNDSFLGTYLLLNLFLALYLIFKSRDELRTYSSVCFSIMFLSLFLSGARAAKFSFGIGLILLSFLWLIFCKKGKLKLLGVSFLTLSLIFAFYFAFSALQPESFVRKGIIEKTVGETFGGRFVVWQKAWENFLKRPLLGWGPENFEFAFTKNYNPCMGASPCGGDIWYDRAHNIIFDTLVTSGMLGMITYIGIFISTFYVLRKNYLQKNFDFWIAGIFAVLLISYSIQNLTVFDMVSSYMMFFLILGFVAGIGKKEIFEAETKPVNHVYLILIFVLFAFSFLEFVISPLRTDAYVISAIQSKPFSEERLNFYKKTLSTSPVGRYQIREFFVDSSLTAQVSEEIPQERIREEFDFLAQELEKSVKESPLNFRSALKLGQLYNAYSGIDPSKLQDAERILKKAIELSPTNQQGYWSLALTRIYQGKFDEALSLAEKALELEPNLEKSHLIVVEILTGMGNLDLAEKKVQEAIKINPAWENDLRAILERS